MKGCICHFIVADTPFHIKEEYTMTLYNVTTTDCAELAEPLTRQTSNWNLHALEVISR